MKFCLWIYLRRVGWMTWLCCWWLDSTVPASVSITSDGFHNTALCKCHWWLDSARVSASGQLTENERSAPWNTVSPRRPSVRGPSSVAFSQKPLYISTPNFTENFLKIFGFKILAKFRVSLIQDGMDAVWMMIKIYATPGDNLGIKSAKIAQRISKI